MAARGSVSTTGKPPGGTGSTSTNTSTGGATVSTPIPVMTDERWQSLSVQSQAILRQVLAPIHLEGYTVSETAKRLGIPVPAVRLLTAYFAAEVSDLATSRAVS